MAKGEGPSSSDYQLEVEDTDESISTQSKFRSVSMDLSKSLPSTTDESSTESAATPVSLLSQLKSPTLADLARKRKVRTIPSKGIK